MTPAGIETATFRFVAGPVNKTKETPYYPTDAQIYNS